MCGIAGYVAKSQRGVPPTIIEEMTRVIAHRGPDGAGQFYFDNFALGHRRLAIIDLSNDAAQPMSYTNGRYVISYNGEIYNYIELRHDLKKYGYQFRSQSDTEVILAAYAHWGEACVDRFNGMWAFVIYDRERRVLFCSRDRFGVKPFYFTDQKGFFAIGSEIRQLLPLLPSVKADRDIVLDFVLTSFADHTQQTFFNGIEKLLPAHNLIYDLQKHSYKIDRYYKVRLRPEIASLDIKQAIEAYATVLTDAVKLRLRSDVRVGTCLSGGVDSSTIATTAAHLHSRGSSAPFSAVTAVSEQRSNDESQFATLVVKHSNLDWIRVKPTYDDFSHSLPAVVQTQEEPFASASICMQYFVMQAARKNGITVLLDGQGGDETLLGYEIYYGVYYISLLVRHGLLAMAKGIRSAQINNSNMGLLNSFKFIIGCLSGPARYWVYRRRHPYIAAPKNTPCYLNAYAKACLDEFALQELEIGATNLPVLLRYEDKNSMAHSVETRLPFIDYRTLETALSLPRELKIRDGWSKWVLRKMMNGHMPDEIVWRKNKMGFDAPDDIWLTRHLPKMIRAVSSSPLLSAMTDIKRLVKAYPRLDKRSQWRFYSVALWENAFRIGG